jgi:hypothetical protein
VIEKPPLQRTVREAGPYIRAWVKTAEAKKITGRVM